MLIIRIAPPINRQGGDMPAKMYLVQLAASGGGGAPVRAHVLFP